MFQVVSVFSDTNISQGSVATRLRCGGTFYYRFSRKTVDEKILKIAYHLTKLRDKISQVVGSLDQSQSTRVTDGQTDGQNYDSQDRASICVAR